MSGKTSKLLRKVKAAMDPTGRGGQYLENELKREWYRLPCSERASYRRQATLAMRKREI